MASIKDQAMNPAQKCDNCGLPHRGIHTCRNSWSIKCSKCGGEVKVNCEESNEGIFTLWSVREEKRIKKLCNALVKIQKLTNDPELRSWQAIPKIKEIADEILKGDK